MLAEMAKTQEGVVPAQCSCDYSTELIFEHYGRQCASFSPFRQNVISDE